MMNSKWEGTMSQFASRQTLLLGAVVFALSFSEDAVAQPGYVPVLQDGPSLWEHPFGGVFPPVQGAALPVWQDPSRPRFAGRTWHIADLSNPNLKQWAKDVLKKDIEEIDAGKIQFTPSSSCLPTGIPNFLQDGGPYLIVQGTDKIVMVDEAGPVVRHIYLNVPHSPNPKPSWMGESVGWYEGDTLVVDTIGINTKTPVDRFGTPHTEKLHVVERWRRIEQGLTLRLDVTVEDPDTFFQPWKTYQEYRRTDHPLQPEICPENNANLFDYGTPEDLTPDF
jgi:hypothetical protein